MVISIYPTISYDIAVAITAASIILTWFILTLRNRNNKSKGHDEKLFKQPPPRGACANCGKEGDDVNNICNKCKQVKYCNATCKKKHRSKHKKHCEEHVRLAAELNDKELFKQPPPKEDCPICFLRIPSNIPGTNQAQQLLHTGSKYQSCCGKVICSGCIHAPLYDNQGNKVDNQKCPFCRTPTPTSIEEGIERLKKRIEAEDSIAMYCLGLYHFRGEGGLAQNYTKALKLYHRAGKLGNAVAYNNIGFAYYNGEGVEVDKKKAVHYWELAAMRGDAQARHNLGCIERDAGNIDRAQKHYMIAIRDGYAYSLNEIKVMYSHGCTAKEDYTEALQLYQTYLGEIKSDQRDKAAAANEDNRFY